MDNIKNKKLNTILNFTNLFIHSIFKKKIKNYKGGYFLSVEYSCSQSDKLIYSYQNFLVPKTFYELDCVTMKVDLINRMETCNYNPDNYKVERIFVKNVPICFSFGCRIKK